MIRWIVTCFLLVCYHPALAQEAERPGPEVLNCIATGYSPEQEAVIEEYKRTFTPTTQPNTAKLVDALVDRLPGCLDLQQASEETIRMVVQHRMSVITREALTANEPEAYRQFLAVNNDIDPDTRDRLYEIATMGLFPDPVTGRFNQPTADDVAFFEGVMTAPPINADLQSAEAIGGLMAAQLLEQVALAYFND